MMHAVLKNWHPMVGVDMHIPWPPGSPAPLPAPVPYNTMQVMGGLLITSKFTNQVFTDSFGLTMLSGTDIGPLIPHIGPPSNTLPFDMLGSSSKSHFFVANIQAEGKPICAALLITVNPNLNCGMPAPTPTGFVMAFTTHMVSMSMADICAGLAAMCCDIALQAACSAIGGAVSGAIMNRIRGPVMRAAFQNQLFRNLMADMPDMAARRAAMIAAAETSRGVDRALGYTVGFFLGGPMGFDAGALGLPTPLGAGSNLVATGTADGEGSGGAIGGGRATGEYLDDPSTPEH
jgi:hypothetical protein